MMYLLYGNPILIAAAVIPAIFLLVQINKADKLDREPVGLLVSLVIQGIISTALAVLTERLGTAILDSLWPENALVYRVLIRAFFRHLCGQLFPQAVRRLLGGEADTVQKALDIEARAAHEDRQTAPGGNVRLERSGQRHEIRHAEGLIRLQNIHRMVRDAVGLFGRNLRRTDV